MEPSQNGPTLQVHAKNVITCGGFYADRLAGLTGGNAKKDQVVTFRGTYYQVCAQFVQIMSKKISSLNSPLAKTRISNDGADEHISRPQWWWHSSRCAHHANCT
jgi:L-2-hydroxyglutarate oxidase LhgO